MRRHQHTASVSYLRGFVNDQSMLSIRRRSGECMDIGVRDATVRRNFYSFRDSAGTHDTVENWFATEVESPAGPILARLRNGDHVRTDDIEVLTLFIAAQLLRTATARSYMAQVDSHLGPWMLANEALRRHKVRFEHLSPLEQQRHLSLAASALAEHHDPDDVRASQLRTTLREISRNHDRLSTWQWRVLAAERPRLITGDAPVVTLQPTRRGFSGLIPDGSPVLLPLSPTQLVVGTSGSAFEFEVVSSELARTVNQRIADGVDDALVKATWQGWPRKVCFGRKAPRLLAPTITVTETNGSTESADRRATFPTRYPEVKSPSIRHLIERLGGTDIVE